MVVRLLVVALAVESGSALRDNLVVEDGDSVVV